MNDLTESNWVQQSRSQFPTCAWDADNLRDIRMQYSSVWMALWTQTSPREDRWGNLVYLGEGCSIGTCPLINICCSLLPISSLRIRYHMPKGDPHYSPCKALCAKKVSDNRMFCPSLHYRYRIIELCHIHQILLKESFMKKRGSEPLLRNGEIIRCGNELP